jgi:HEAT repeat protein
MNNDPDKALPILESVINGNASPRVKDRALFVLAQSDSPKAQQILLNVARGQSHPELQRKAIQYLGTEGTPANIKALGDIYASVQDPGVRRAVIQAFLTADAKDQVLAAAKHEPDADVRRFAIHTLGAMDAKAELAQMYQGANVDTKEAIVEACVAADDGQLLSQIARNANEDPNVRRRALQSLGAVGGPSVNSTLVQIYRTDTNAELRNAAIEGLFVSEDAHDLIELANAEKDPNMRLRIVEKLSVMDTPEARDYMVKILNK